MEAGRHQGRRRPQRQGPYKLYAERGGMPRSTWYDIRRRERNIRNVPQDVNDRGNRDHHELPAQADALPPGDHNVEVIVPNAADEALLQDDERPGDEVGEDANVNNELFADEFINRGQENDEIEDEPVLTAGPKDIERDENLAMNVTENLGTTKFEALLMVLTFALRHGLTTVAIEDLLSMINVILGGNIHNGVLPGSKYLFQKIFASDMAFKFHMYCPDCMIYIGEITPELKAANTAPCRQCAKQVKVPGMRSTDFFVTLPIGSQIAELLQGMDDVFDQLNYRWDREPSDNIRDVYDGRVYKNLMEEGNFLSNRNNLSLTFSTDGAAVFESGCTTMWPIFFRLNELKPSVRFSESNCMLAGLWFGKKKPLMGMYFRPFLHECENLYNHGIHWKTRDNRIINSKIITLNCVMDSGAKHLLQGTKQYNGFQSCPYCDHPGATYNGNNMCKWPMNNARVHFEDKGISYTVEKHDRVLDVISDHDVYDRTNEEMRRDMEQAEVLRQNRSIDGYKGIKYESPLCYLQFFDVCLGFQIDYMHSVLCGTSRHLFELWFDPLDKENTPFYLGLKIPQINERLLSITPPTSISRRPTTLLRWTDWHANELRSWLLYYSLPCLKGILPTVYYKHHCVLVSAIHMLLKDDITSEELDASENYLAEYVTEFEVLYGKEEMFFNVHLLLHFAKSVLHWGPLWCYSMFPFESSNNRIMKLVTGSTGVASQVVSKYSISKFLPHLLKVYDICDEVVTYCSELMCYKRFTHAEDSGGVKLVGRQANRQLTDEERRAFHGSGIDATSLYYERMLKDRFLYSCRLYSRKGDASDDCIVRLSDGTYAVIIRIIRHINDGEVFLLLRKIHTNRGFITCHEGTGARARHIKVCPQIVYGNLFVRNARHAVANSIFMTFQADGYITDFPNTVEKD